MWSRLCILWTLLWVARCAPSTMSACPEHCECSPLEGRQLEAHCSSQAFLDKIGLKQVDLIASLDLRSQSIKRVDHKLKRLHNLKKLDLSDNAIADLKKFPQLPKLKDLNLKGNRIQHLTAAELPKSVEYLDVSFNNITYITDVSDMLPNLKELDLNNNMVSCECDFLKERDYLLQNGVHIVRPVLCRSPPAVKGKSMLLVYCSQGNVMYDDAMAADEPDFGSGDVVDAVPTFDDDFGGSGEANIEDEYSVVNGTDDVILTEGSGEGASEARSKVLSEEVDYEDYGSGEGDFTSEPTETTTTLIELTESNVRACFFNCSTPPPSKTEDDNTEPSPNVIDEITKIFKELTGQTEATTALTTPKEEVTERIAVVKVADVSSSNNRAGKILNEPGGPRKDKEAETTKTDLHPKEVEKAPGDTKESNTTFIVVGILLGLMAALIAYAVFKKRSKRSNNRRPAATDDEEKNPGVEMKPLMPAKPTANDANNLAAEKTPLMNGQNGTRNKEVDEPEAAVEHRQAVVESDGKVLRQEEAVESAAGEDSEDVVVRPKRDDANLLTPETRRVTIQAKELTSPKTPVFVHRHLSDDGRIITTPSLEQSN